MDSKHASQPSLQISQEKFLAFARAVIGASTGREDDEHPLPPGPWDPHIRAALERINVFGPRPEPWKIAFASILARHPEIHDAIGGGHGFGAEVALNPQPLPPRFAFLAAVVQAVVSRAELIHEVAGATAREGEDRGIIIVGGYTGRFLSGWCGSEFRLRWPFPGPRPHWFTHQLDGVDLVVIATQFEQAARESFNPDLRRHFAGVSAQFVEAGVSRISGPT
jgi:hypothetical protein